MKWRNVHCIETLNNTTDNEYTWLNNFIFFEIKNREKSKINDLFEDTDNNVYNFDNISLCICT